MILDDIMTVGGLLVNVGLAYVAVRQQARIQELEGFRSVQEEMQRRGCKNVRELDQSILNEIHEAEDKKLITGPQSRQKALPAPQDEQTARRAQRVPVKGTGRPYDASQEAYTDDVETVRVQPRRRNVAYPRNY